jgi:hypothetical protein
VPLDGHARAVIGAAVDALAEALDAEPRSRRWRMRSRLGERVRWYDPPDDIDADR